MASAVSSSTASAATATTTTTTTTTGSNDEKQRVLNVATFPGGYQASVVGDGTPSADIARLLNKQIMVLYADFVSDDGNGVAYDDLRTSAAFADYVNNSAQLQLMDMSELSQQELLAFCLNIYNALIIHANIVIGPPDASVKGELGKFFKTVAYNIGGLVYSADDIEHGILRGNQIHPTSKTRFFEDSDPRAAIVIKTIDPRIHFALVCGAKSCPPIRIFKPSNLDRGLRAAAHHFCCDNVQVDVTGGVVTLSKIFQWYGSDFAPTEPEILQWITECMLQAKDGSRANNLGKALTALLSDKDTPVTVKYADYDWSLNSKM